MSDWILTTGFGAFPGVQRNPTQSLSEQLAGLNIEGTRLSSAVFNVSFERSKQELKELLRQRSSPPLAMIHFGVASSSSKIRIERRAVNCKSAEIADVDGAYFKDTPIDDDFGLEFIRETSLDVAQLVARLQMMGIPVRESNDAGRYVCNSIYFHSLRYAQDLHPRAASLFVHVPSIGTSVEAAGVQFHWTEAQMLCAAQHIVQWVAHSQRMLVKR